MKPEDYAELFEKKIQDSIDKSEEEANQHPDDTQLDTNGDAGPSAAPATKVNAGKI